MVTEMLRGRQQARSHRGVALDEIRPVKVTCMDGYVFWIRAGSHHGCHPKKYLKSGAYVRLEIYVALPYEVFLSGHEDQNCGRYNDVPIHEVDALINCHGGVKFWE